jgi:ubiquinone/menaquinone biosynthesis C-methylase UbiE
VDDDTRRVRSAAFSAVADVYERTRPGYPDPAVDWLLGTEPKRVLELGAGTGKLTRSLVARGHTVVATDPSAPMLAELTRAGLPVRTTVAGAEHLPFAAQSFDAVVVAQAFHWFDLASALPEIARVLRPRGTLAVVWNLRDGSVPWVRRLTELLRNSENDATGRMYGSSDEPASMSVVEASPLFREVESRSGVALLGGDERRELIRKVEALYAEYGRDRQGMRLPYVTHSFRTAAAPPPAPPPEPSGGTDDDALLFDFR